MDLKRKSIINFNENNLCANKVFLIDNINKKTKQTNVILGSFVKHVCVAFIFLEENEKKKIRGKKYETCGM